MYVFVIIKYFIVFLYEYHPNRDIFQYVAKCLIPKLAETAHVFIPYKKRDASFK